MFRAPKRVRKKAAEDAGDDDEPVPAATQSAAGAAATAKPAAKKSKPTPSIGLSFDMEDEGEAIQVKKKKKKAQPVPIAMADEDNGSSSRPVGVFTGAGIYTQDMLKQLRSEQAYRTAPEAGDDGPIPGDVLPGADGQGLASAALPDADAIRAARAQRERARRLAGAAEDEDGGGGGVDGRPAAYMRLDGGREEDMPDEDAEEPSHPTSRLVREEDVDEEPHIYDEGSLSAREASASSVFPPERRKPSAVAALGRTSATADTVVSSDDEAPAIAAAQERERAPTAVADGVKALLGAAATEEAIAAHAARLTSEDMGARTLEQLGLELTRCQSATSEAHRALDDTQRLLGAAADTPTWRTRSRRTLRRWSSCSARRRTPRTCWTA